MCAPQTDRPATNPQWGAQSSAGQKAKRLPGPVFTANLKQIANHAAASHMPSIYNVRDFAEAGGLVTYGPDRVDLFRRAAIYVDKILKGAKPGDLPVEQPTKFELVINMKTANALGLKIPSSSWCTRPE